MQGLSLEQVDELYAKESRAWKSKNFVPTVQFTDVKGMDSASARQNSLADLESAAAARRKSEVTHSEHVINEKY
jgi:MFS transporter, SP family, sugar:H+ symporter